MWNVVTSVAEVVPALRSAKPWSEDAIKFAAVSSDDKK
jgi:hypothetical protein